MENAPLSRDQQVSLMMGAKKRREDNLRRWLEDKEIKAILLKPHPDLSSKEAD